MNNDLLEKLLQSRKYREVCPDTVRRIWAECSAKYRKPKEADKAAREALHGVTGAFLTPAEARACGINPLYLGARGIPTTGIDISGEAVGLVNAAGKTYGMPVEAICADLLCDNALPERRCDVALLFKVLPLLERQKNGSASRLMRAIDAAHLVVSFPTRTLGGRNVGMAAHYSDWMAAHLPKNRHVAERFETENELFFVIE